MRIAPICEQKGLRTYLAIKASPDRHARLRATMINGDRTLDVPVVRCYDDGGHLAIVLPATSVNPDSHIEVEERHTGIVLASVDIARANNAAKVSRRAPKRFTLFQFVDEVDAQNPLRRGQYDLNLEDCFDTYDGEIVWRIAIDWHGSKKSKPCLELIGSDFDEIDATIHEFEFQEELIREERIAKRMIATFRLPKSLTNFCLFAHDPQKEITPNFYPMDSLAASNLVEKSSALMLSIDEQHCAYADWLVANMEKLRELESEWLAADKDTLHVIVFDKNSSGSRLDRTLESLQAQNFDQWTATVLSPDVPNSKNPTSRIDFMPLPNANQMKNAIKKIAEESGAIRICMVEAGDVFASGAFSAIANTPGGSQNVLVFNEDSVDDEGLHFSPKFKGALNKQLEYTENWAGYGIFFPTELIVNATLGGMESPTLAAYSLTLEAIEQELPFESIPYVLLHTLSTPGKDATARNTFPSHETGAAKKILFGHLCAMGANVVVKDGFLEGTLKISLPAESKPGKVSIVIPTMDHSDMLEKCVSSILSRSAYTDIEIVLVENNSTEKETFELYERLQRENPGVVKVMKWEGPFNYSAIVNYGAAASTGDFLLLLNNDTEVITPRFIEEMLALATIPEVGVVGAKLYFRDMLVQHAGMLIGPYDGISHVNQNFSDIRPGYQNRALTQCSFSSVTGACQMMRRGVFEEVGGYDETFVVGFNDADFCLKVRAAGYDVVFTPYAELYHYEFVSRGREGVDEEKQARWERERDAFFEKWQDELSSGDPLLSPNFNKDNWYYALPSSSS